MSDLGLPEIDGWTLTTESSGDIPPIALAADRIERDRNAAWLLGFQMLLCEQIEPAQLVTAVIKPIGHPLPSKVSESSS